MNERWKEKRFMQVKTHTVFSYRMGGVGSQIFWIFAHRYLTGQKLTLKNYSLKQVNSDNFLNVPRRYCLVNMLANFCRKRNYDGMEI